MMRDIEYYIKRCLTCQRNKSMNGVLEHNAKALKTSHIFQRICMDIVSGLPTSSEGYCKILVIVEYLSKHVTIIPLKTKTAAEVAEGLWSWIALYGAPSVILTDMGSEFVNATVKCLTERVGSEHRVTSAYSPRTDGQCERMNQTVIFVMKKHAEAEPFKWPRWASYISFSYNTRICPTTGFSPNQVLYGVETNTFKDYSKTKDNQNDLFIRSQQLKELVESDRDQCKKAIEKAQEV